MRKINQAIAGIIASAIFVSLGIYIWKTITPRSLCSELSCVVIPGGSTYRLKEIYTDTQTVYRSLYSSGNRFIRIEAQHTDPIQGAANLDASVLRMKALFEKAPAPYPGDISDAIVCDPAFAPIYRTATLSDNTLMRYFTGYLNNRMTFGSCSQDQAVYKGIMAFMYCPTKQLTIRIELIAPIHDFLSNEEAFQKQILALRCEKPR